MRNIFAFVFSIAFSFFAHTVIAIPEIYFILGAVNAAIVMLILQG